jgi:hypothetical protein
MSWVERLTPWSANAAAPIRQLLHQGCLAGLPGAGEDDCRKRLEENGQAGCKYSRKGVRRFIHVANDIHSSHESTQRRALFTKITLEKCRMS